MPEETVKNALSFFGFEALSDLRDGGHLLLRRRYTEFARRLHPDSGGSHASFLMLRKNYDILRSSLHYAHAAGAVG